MKDIFVKLGLLGLAATGLATAAVDVVGPNWATPSGGTIRILGSGMLGALGSRVCYSPTELVDNNTCPVEFPISGSPTATDITATVPSGLGLSNSGIVQVYALNPNGNTVAGTKPFFVLANASISISGLSPTSRVLGSSDTTATVTVSNDPGGVYTVTMRSFRDFFGVSPLSGSFSGATLTGTIPATSMTFPHRHLLFAHAQPQVGQPLNSGFVQFNVSDMTISSAVPSSVLVNGGPISLTVNGSFPTLVGNPPSTGTAPTLLFFRPGIGSNLLIPTSVTSTQLTVTVPNSLLNTVTTALLSALITSFEYVSNSIPFNILPSAPALTDATPNPAPRNTATLFTLSGTNLSPLTSLAFTPPGGAPVSLTPSSATATSITVTVPAANMAALGTGTFTVTTPSGSATRTVVIAVPTLTSISPNSALQGASNTVVTLTGTNFLMGSATSSAQFRAPGSAVYQDISTVISASTTATIPAASLTTAGNGFVRFRVGNAFSADQPFTVIAPVLSSASPASATAGGAQFTITLTGTNLNAGGTPVVRFTPPGGVPTNLPIVGTPTATQVQATVSAALIATAGNATIQLQTGTAVSNIINFTILPPINISSFSPPFTQTASAGTPPFLLTVNGSGFDNGSVVSFGGIDMPTQFVNQGQLIATIAQNFIATPGVRDVVARDSLGRTSNTLPYSVLPPIVIQSLNPSSREAGLPTFTLTINGIGFEPISTVSFAGATVSSTFVNANLITATIPGNFVANPGSYNVTVSDNRGRTSAPATFTVTPAGSLQSLNPTFTEAGSGPITLTLNGRNLVPEMTLNFGVNRINTTFVNASQVTALIPANLLTTVQQVPVNLQPPSGGTPTNTLTFSIVENLRITSIFPVRANAGIQGFTLNVTGQGIVAGAVIRFGAANLTTTFVNATTLTGLVPAALLAAPGAVNVQVQNPSGSLSNPLTFTILPALRIQSITPNNVQVNSATFTMGINGDGFTTDSVVRVGGLILQTTFLNQNQLTAVVPNSLTAAPGDNDVVVVNPLNAISNAVVFTVGTNTPFSISGVNPTGAPLNGPPTPIVVTGSGFTNQAVVRFNGTEIPTTFVNAGQLNATIPGEFLRTAGSFPITVAIGSLVSGPVSFLVGNRPELTFLNPAAITAGARAFSLIVLGRGFLNGSRIKFGDQDLVTTFQGSSQLSGLVSADLVARARTVPVVVTNPDGQASNSLDFRVVDLTLTSLNPERIAAGSAGFSLGLSGTGFINGATVSFGGAGVTTSFGSSTSLSAQIPASAIQTAGEVQVTVTNPDGARSNALRFIIDADTPSITRLNPASALVGSDDVTINIIGGGFVRGSSVSANGSGIAGSFNSPTSMDAVIPAALLRTIGSVRIRVTNPGNKQSNEVGFAVVAPTPSITNVNPSTFNAGAAANVNIVVTGSNFVSGAVVLFNGQEIGTTFVNSTTLNAVIPASALGTPGNATIQVSNPGGVQSNVLQGQILPPLTVTSVSPSVVVGGNANVTITVTGTGFVNGATVQLGATSLATTFLSGTSLTAIIPPGLQGAAATLNLSVRNPNGATSNSVQFRIEAPLVSTSINLQVPATIVAAGNGQVQVTLNAPAPVAMSGTIELTFVANASNSPAGYVDPALLFQGSGSRRIGFTVAQGATNGVIPANGAFSPGTVAGTITVTVVALSGNNQDLLPRPAPSRTVTIDRVAPSAVPGSVRITNIAGGIQVELNGISVTREVSRITFSFTAAGVTILEGQSIPVDVATLFNTYFASEAGRAAGGGFRFTMPFTISGGDASGITQVSVTITNAVGTSTAVTGGR